MTSYNRERYISNAIESVLASTYTNFELIIVDDVSIDKTFEIESSYAKNDSRIRLYRNEKNLGDYPNRNKAASYANGKFLMYVDSDDMVLQDGIENCLRAISIFPDANFCMYSVSAAKEPFKLNTANALREHFFKKPFLMIGPGGTVTRRTYFEKIKGYPEKYGPANDMYFNLKATCLSPIVMLPFDFMYYRRHEGQEINNAYSYLIYNYNYLKDALAELPMGLNKKEIDWLSKKNKRRFFVNIIRYFLKTGNISETRNAIKACSFKLHDSLEAVFQL